MSTAVRENEGFASGVHTDWMPSRVDTRDVRQVDAADVPAALRDHALYAVGDMSGGTWWTAGQFRYADGPGLRTAVARRVGAQIQYGIRK